MLLVAKKTDLFPDMKKGHIYIYIFPDMKKTPEKNVQNMMKYWFGTINIYIYMLGQ